MATLGGVATDYIIPGVYPPEGLREIVTYKHVDGYDGYFAKKLGKAGGEFNAVCLNIDTDENNDIWIANIEALSSTIVSLVFSAIEWYGSGTKTYTGLLITNIQGLKRKALSQGGSLIEVVQLSLAGVKVQ